jgi:hypothetical protein
MKKKTTSFGRPKKNPEDKLEYGVRFFLTKAEKEEFEEIMREKGIKKESELGRRIVRAYLKAHRRRDWTTDLDQ